MERNRIIAFYVENFKSIKEETWIPISNITLLTGANNSGKSTLFKALKIITEGFVEGDFPIIEVQKIIPDTGFFDDLLNFNSSKQYFKIGIRYKSEKYHTDFDLIFRFEKGESKHYAEFAELDVLKGTTHFLSFFSSVHFEKNLKNSDFSSFFFKSISGGNNPGEIIFFINLDVLKSIKSNDSFAEYIDVFGILEKNFSKYWSGELLNEDDYCERKNYIRISDELFFDFYHDYFCNLVNYDQKYPVFYDDDNGEAENEYRNKTKDYDFKGFIKEYFQEFFNEISSQIRFFYNKRLFHIELSESFQSRIIKHDSIGFTIPELVWKEREVEVDPEPESNKNQRGLFTRYEPLKEYSINKLFKIFDLDGCVITENVQNSGSLVFYHDYKSNKTINIFDLGKGHARLIQLLLAIVSRIVLRSDEDYGKRKSRSEPDKIILHLEEPEAFMHPAWQSKLADLFVFISKHTNTQIIIETHSVYLIQKFQLLVGRKKINPTDISIYYFEGNSGETAFRKINIRKDGILKESFGEGFYDESAQLAIELLNIENFN